MFFPEKRSFFLEGAGVYDVAGLANTTDIRPFFSRRVGLVDDVNGDSVTVPLRLGVKLSGRESDYNIGVLDVETGSQSDPALPNGFVDRQNLFAARVSRNILEQSWIGGIVTHGNPTGTGANTLIGADARLATSTFRGDQNLSLALYLLGTDDETSRSRAGAGGFTIDYPNDRWDVSLSWKHIGDRFQPALGFVPRTGIRKTDLYIAFQPRPERWGIRQFFFEFEPTYITNLQNRVENWRIFTAPFNTRPNRASISSGTTFRSSNTSMHPSRSRRGLWYRPAHTSGHVSAPRRTAPRSVRGSSMRHCGGAVSMEGRAGSSSSDHPEAEHARRALGAERAQRCHLAAGFLLHANSTVRADYNFTPNVSWANLAQYDNESRIAGLQSRFRWILKPGNDLFLVLNRGWYRTLDDPRFEPSFDRGSAKLQYTFRF